MRLVRSQVNRRGAALVMALLISVAIAAMALGAIVVASGANLTTLFAAKEATLQAAADGGLAMIRDTVNRGTFDSLLPDTGYTTIANSVAVLDAFGTPYAGITRSLYVGRTGGRTGGAATAGQYGSNFASALSIISNTRGAVAARRLLMTQESWAKYAVAVNNWSNTSNYYGCDESINGPFFSNTSLVIQGFGSPCGVSKTLFAGSVNVVGSILNVTNGNYRLGYSTGVTPIVWPTPAKVALMQKYAQDGDAAGGDYDITGSTLGTKAPSVRIEFVTIDVNGNGIIDWNEGFMRVWVAANTSDSALAYATGKRWPNGATAGTLATTADPNMVSRNCGAVTTIAGATRFYNANQIYNGGGSAAAVRTALTSGTSRRCYMGGDPHLFEPTTGDTLTPAPALTNAAVWGSWKTRRLGPLASIAAKRSGDAAYLIPLGSNPSFKGVIFVTGDVAISGQLRGRLSVFSTGNIVLADDLLYYVAPGTECDAQGDIMGAIATKDVVIEDNNLQTPFYVTSPATSVATLYGGFDDSPNDENYNMFILATGSSVTTDGNWYGEWASPPWSAPVNVRYGASVVDASATAQRCGQAANGCVRVSGGIAEGRFDNATYIGGGSSANFGWAEKHTYDPCGAVNPPPYFPTTGRFTESRYYEVDPVWLKQMTIGDYFRRLRAQ